MSQRIIGSSSLNPLGRSLQVAAPSSFAPIGITLLIRGNVADQSLETIRSVHR